MLFNPDNYLYPDSLVAQWNSAILFPTTLDVVVQSLSHAQLFVTPWTAAHQASLSFTISHSLLKLMSIESVMPSNHLILCRFLLLLPSIFPNIKVFSNELALRITWPKYWSFSFSISPANEYSGLISFMIDWFDLLADQRIWKSLLQHRNLKASILWCSAFFMVQLSHLSVTTGKTMALIYWPLSAKWCLCILIHCLGLSWLFFQGASFNSMAAVTICSDFGAQENKICHCFHLFPMYFPWSDGTRCHDLSFLNVEF